MDESGRKIATSVRTFEPISGISVKYCKIEKMAGEY
jgi:transposase